MTMFDQAGESMNTEDAELVERSREFLASAHEGANKPLVAIDIRTGNVGRQGVAWVETLTALAAIRAALTASGITRVEEENVRLRNLIWEMDEQVNDCCGCLGQIDDEFRERINAAALAPKEG